MIESFISGQDVKIYCKVKILNAHISKYGKINFALESWKWNLIMNPPYSESKMIVFIKIFQKLQNFIIRDNFCDFLKIIDALSILHYCKYFIPFRGKKYVYLNANYDQNDKHFQFAIFTKCLILWNSSKILKSAISSKQLDF